jgi:hypothetical protein
LRVAAFVIDSVGKIHIAAISIQSDHASSFCRSSSLHARLLRSASCSGSLRSRLARAALRFRVPLNEGLGVLSREHGLTPVRLRRRASMPSEDSSVVEQMIETHPDAGSNPVPAHLDQPFKLNLL